MSDTYITYGTTQIPFEIKAKRGDSPRITIKVKPNCNVVVLAPSSAQHDEIIVAVNKRAKWVIEKIQFFKYQIELDIPRQYLSGESFLYLGRNYTLKIIKDSSNKSQVKLLNGKICIYTIHDKENYQKLLMDWYRKKSLDVFYQRLEKIILLTPWVKEIPEIKVKQMKTRWGSCSKNGKITLNINLVKAPMDCIDYVIIHELCHLVEHNHSDNFYKLLSKIMPNWKMLKENLDKKAFSYLR